MDESPCWFPRYMWEINIEYIPEVRLLGHIVGSSIFWGTSIICSIESALIFTILSKCTGFPFLPYPCQHLLSLAFFPVSLCIWVYMCDCVYVCEWVSEWERVRVHVWVYACVPHDRVCSRDSVVCKYVHAHWHVYGVQGKFPSAPVDRRAPGCSNR